MTKALTRLIKCGEIENQRASQGKYLSKNLLTSGYRSSHIVVHALCCSGKEEAVLSFAMYYRLTFFRSPIYIDGLLPLAVLLNLAQNLALNAYGRVFEPSWAAPSRLERTNQKFYSHVNSSRRRRSRS